MSEFWMVTNSASGSYDAALADRIAMTLGVTRRIVLPDDELPDARSAEGVERIAVFTGDGTVNAAVDALAGWAGELLVLPGGTMNLLSRRLHGEAKPEEIVERVAAGRTTVRQMPMIEGCGRTSLVGVIAGPTAMWGEVREDLRHLDLKGLIESVPAALSETLGGDKVSIRGDGRAFQAIFIDVAPGRLVAQGVSAANAAELAQHGLAWLTGDFMGGPSELLGEGTEFTVEGPREMALLVDGERCSTHGPCRFTLGACAQRFVATLPAA